MEPWKTYRKITLTRARQAHEDGISHTLEGPVAYAAGDYVCIGIVGEEWPRRRDRFEAIYDMVAGSDAEGFSSYRKRDTVTAQRQVIKPKRRKRTFNVTLADGQVITGKDGDYIVRDSVGSWIVAATIFAATYELVE